MTETVSPASNFAHQIQSTRPTYYYYYYYYYCCCYYYTVSRFKGLTSRSVYTAGAIFCRWSHNNMQCCQRQNLLYLSKWRRLARRVFPRRISQ